MSLTLLKNIIWTAAGFLILLYPTLTLAAPGTDRQETGEDIYLQQRVVDKGPTITAKELIERLTRLEERLTKLEERLIRLEERLEEGQKNLQAQINDLKDFMLWGFGIMIAVMGVIVAGMFSLVGFVMWDRRTALAPAIKKTSELEEREVRREEREKKIEWVLKELALKDTNVATALRTAGIS
ncbi:MAG: hypothetical protein QME81_02045 [bacterium]|nr:hypothetical protein [bacterium]